MKNRIEAAKLVHCLGRRVGTAWPRMAERMVMTISDEMAAEKTSVRECFMAIKAAIRNVLSPISANRIMINDIVNEWNGVAMPPSSESGI